MNAHYIPDSLSVSFSLSFSLSLLTAMPNRDTENTIIHIKFLYLKVMASLELNIVKCIKIKSEFFYEDNY